ncbi:antiterminator Q family protein [Yersinia intermedia]|uniref:antiterminator Q family protein n=1 Tax=Yersinia intermedia TaxID=631 RepID=UPI0005E922BA|nr:antiterminator Q family protein [Yersinia intermedia]MCB5311938.1 antitermination protein [Yersinia intermedia]MCB5325337.1 antitermination protein [Yersinia intermedia]CNH14767.1 phage antitermination protein Q [Yersinia intermedia]CQD78093.1 phage antitermination protein Q [Yersinia intermedia]
MRDIQLVLERWGGWAANEDNGVGYSPIAAGFKGLLPSTSKTRLSCCDNDGLLVDAAVGRLKKAGRNEDYDLIEQHYKKGISKSAIARRQKCSEGKIRLKLMMAENFIDACLIMAGARLEMDEWTYKSDSTKNVSDLC